MEKKAIIKKVEDQKYFIRRLNIIGGQIKGVTKMIEDNRDYEELLIQLGAVINSLKTVERNILENYMINNLDSKDEAAIKEAINLYNKLI